MWEGARAEGTSVAGHKARKALGWEGTRAVGCKKMA